MKKIKVEHIQGQQEQKALIDACEALIDGIDAIAKPFDGEKLAKLMSDLDNVREMLGKYCVKVVTIDTGLGVVHFRPGDTIQTGDKGANGSSGRIVDFSPDGMVAKYQKSNGTIGEAHVTYIRQF